MASPKAMWAVGLPAAQVVVVHGRADHHARANSNARIRARRGVERTLLAHAEQARRGDQQKGPQALAAAERRVAHRFSQIGHAGGSLPLPAPASS